MTKKTPLLILGSQVIVILLGYAWGMTIDHPSTPGNSFTFLGGLAILLVFILGLAPWIHDSDDPDRIKRRVVSFLFAIFLLVLYLSDQFLHIYLLNLGDVVRVLVLLAIIILLNIKLLKYHSFAAIGGMIFLFVSVAMTFYNTKYRDIGLGFFSEWWGH